jgi:hypothetical protein
VTTVVHVRNFVHGKWEKREEEYVKENNTEGLRPTWWALTSSMSPRRGVHMFLLSSGTLVPRTLMIVEISGHLATHVWAKPT